MLGFGFSVLYMWFWCLDVRATCWLTCNRLRAPAHGSANLQPSWPPSTLRCARPLCITCIQAHAFTTSIRACVMPHCTADFALKAQVHRNVSAPTPSITTDFPHPILPLLLAATRSARRAGPLAAASATATSTCAAPSRQQLFLLTAFRFCLCALTAVTATISSM